MSKITTYLVEWPKPKTLAAPNTSGNMEQQNSYSLLVGMQSGTATLEESFQLLTKLILLLPYYLAMVFFGSYPKELNSYIYTKTCTWIFRAALFRIVNTWK